MLADVLGSLRHVPGLDAVVVVTADPVAESAARSRGVTVLHDSEQAGQSPAAAIGIRFALAEGFVRALLVPGDTPLLDPDEVAALLDRAGDPSVAIVPDRHGTGTNALLLSPPDAIEPSFGPGSFERHRSLAHAAGVACTIEEIPSLMHDVDTPDDLSALAAVLDGRRGHAASTRGALRQLDRSRARDADAPSGQAAPA
jgi:2-phospho-L-lactate guanylyltransferase